MTFVWRPVCSADEPAIEFLEEMRRGLKLFDEDMSRLLRVKVFKCKCGRLGGWVKLSNPRRRRFENRLFRRLAGEGWRFQGNLRRDQLRCFCPNCEK